MKIITNWRIMGNFRNTAGISLAEEQPYFYVLLIKLFGLLKKWKERKGMNESMPTTITNTFNFVFYSFHWSKGSNNFYHFTIKYTIAHADSHTLTLIRTYFTHTLFMPHLQMIYTVIERNFMAIFKLILQTMIIDCNFINAKRFRDDCRYNYVTILFSFCWALSFL